METFDDTTKAAFLQRSYLAVDGLWFIHLQTERSYNEALRVDQQVWEMLAKIQAGKAKELLQITDGTMESLGRALTLKLSCEGHEARIARCTDDVLRLELSSCPWLQTLWKTGRSGIGKDVCERLFIREYTFFAREFDPDMHFEFEGTLTEKDADCALIFTKKASGEGAPDPVPFLD